MHSNFAQSFAQSFPQSFAQSFALLCHKARSLRSLTTWRGGEEGGENVNVQVEVEGGGQF